MSRKHYFHTSKFYNKKMKKALQIAHEAFIRDIKKGEKKKERL